MRKSWVSRLALLVIMSVISPVSQAQVLLEARFNDKPIDQVIGTGGAAVGEPVSFSASIGGFVRDTPTATPSVELVDGSDFSALPMRFEFLGDQEITSGTVVISMDLWFAELQRYQVLIRENGGASRTFCNVLFAPDGSITQDDADSGPQMVGNYTAGTSHTLILSFDLDSGTYDVSLDGALLVENETHGITDRGVGAVIVGLGSDPDTDGTLYLDNLFVEVPELPYYVDGFEDQP